MCAHTFAALNPVVDIPSCAIAALHGSHRVDAFAFAVTAAVIFQALVDVCVHPGFESERVVGRVGT